MPKVTAPSLAELSPMLLEERRAVPLGDWHFEIKYDGYRLLASTEPVQLKSRNGHDATAWYPEVAAAIANLKPGCIFDGEVCVLDEIGKSNVELLHARAAQGLVPRRGPGGVRRLRPAGRQGKGSERAAD